MKARKVPITGGGSVLATAAYALDATSGLRARAEIEERLAYVLADERLRYPNATIAENAPLALIQLSQEVEARTLCWVLQREFVHPRKAKP